MATDGSNYQAAAFLVTPPRVVVSEVRGASRFDGMPVVILDGGDDAPGPPLMLTVPAAEALARRIEQRLREAREDRQMGSS